MTTNDTNTQGDWDRELPIGALLRAEADGELDAPERSAERSRLEAHLESSPEDAERIAFERDLKSACGRVMGSATCPSALRDRIAQMAVETRGMTDADEREEAFADRIAARSSDLHTAGIFGGARGRVLGAIAAALLLVASAAFVVRVTGAMGTGGVDTSATTLVAGMVSAEHNSCMVSAKENKFVVTERSGVPGYLSEILGSEASIGALEEQGLRFDRLGQCKVPGDGKSVHLIFTTAGIEGCSGDLSVSLFIQAGGHPDFTMDPGTTYTIGKPDKHTVYAWNIDGMSYYLVAPNESCKALSPALPDKRTSLIDG